jgi:DNA-binding NtrC family response regulator
MMNEMKKRIMVLDDEELIRDAFRDLLKDAGYETISAKDPQEALEQMLSNPADVLLLDLSLGAEDGLEFLPKFKALYTGVPVVILTGIGYDNAKIKTALERGAAGYFSKETGLENIIPALERIIA